MQMQRPNRKANLNPEFMSKLTSRYPYQTLNLWQPGRDLGRIFYFERFKAGFLILNTIVIYNLRR